MTTKEYISKDEVEVILKKYHRYSKSLEEIRVLPTFSPEKIIENMIEEHKNKKILSYQNDSFQSYASGWIDGLQHALTRLRAENIS